MKQQKQTTGISTAWLVVAVATAALSYAGPHLLDALQVNNQPPSLVKPYADLRAFRPRYQNDHQNQTSVQLHVVGTSLIMLLSLMNPELIGAGILAAKCGQLAFSAFRHQDNGLSEAAIMFVTFLATTRLLHGSTKLAWVVLFLGYGFAWTGHFFFEGNRPATFIYPTYSLICDFLMWAENVTGATITL